MSILMVVIGYKLSAFTTRLLDILDKVHILASLLYAQGN